MKKNEILEKVAEFSKEINAMGQPTDGTAYLIVAIDTEMTEGKNTNIAFGGSFLDMACLLHRVVNDKHLRRPFEEAMFTNIMLKFGDLIKERASEKPSSPEKILN